MKGLEALIEVNLNSGSINVRNNTMAILNTTAQSCSFVAVAELQRTSGL